MISYVFDAEADGFRDEATQVWCISIRNVNTPEIIWHYGPDQLDEAFIRLNQADVLIGHNIINYDLPLFKRLHNWEPRKGMKIEDSVIHSRLLRSDRRIPQGCHTKSGPHSLEAWGFRVGVNKPAHDDWTQYSPEMVTRCNEDTLINYLTWKVLVAERHESSLNWTAALDLEHRIAYIITQQEINGVPFDRDAAQTIRAELKVGIMDIDEELVPTIPEVKLSKSKQKTWPRKQFKKDGSPSVAALRYYGDGFTTYRTDIIVKTAPINLGSDKQVKEYLLSIGWKPVEWNYKKDPVTKKPLRDMMGNKVQTSPKLTEESYDSLDSDIGQTIGLRLKMAHRLSLIEGLVNNIRPDGKLTASAIPMGTPSSRMTHRVVVNIPGEDAYLGHELRGLFGTEPGYVRVGIDLVNCQLRGLCHYMGDEPYQRAVLSGNKEDGTDSHSLTRDLAGLKTRQQGKRFTYAILFGAGDEHLAAILGISVTEAAFARKKFFANLIKLDELMKTWAIRLRTMGYMQGLDGRALWVRSPHAIMSFMLQDLEAVVMKDYLIHLTRNAYHLDYKLVTTMHDEVQFLVRRAHLSAFRVTAKEAITRINVKYKLECPQAIDFQVGETWADCH